jgi:hypothetical protein
VNEFAGTLSRRATVTSAVTSKLGAEAGWLAVMAATTLIELGWWAAAWIGGLAPLPYLGTYLLLAGAGLTAALAAKATAGRLPSRAAWPSIAAATLMVAIGASLFLPLKYIIPSEVPFWLDGPLASGERALLGADPWLVLDHFMGWATVPLDRLYGLWLPLQTFVLFLVILDPPSRAKSRALIAYSLAWLVLGVAAAAALSSAGPLFYDRLFGGGMFAALRETLQARGAWMALAESDKMWASLASGRPGFVAGISAAPSMHVAISLWMAFVARVRLPKIAPLAVLYTLLIWIGSVQLGWHYVSDGLAGAIGMAAIWALAGFLERKWRKGWDSNPR